VPTFEPLDSPRLQEPVSLVEHLVKWHDEH
jgi:hypothetical protein